MAQRNNEKVLSSKNREALLAELDEDTDDQPTASARTAASPKRERPVRPVEMVDAKTGEVIQVFASMSEAQKRTGIARGTIATRIRKGYISDGVGWRNATSTPPPPLPQMPEPAPASAPSTRKRNADTATDIDQEAARTKRRSSAPVPSGGTLAPLTNTVETKSDTTVEGCLVCHLDDDHANLMLCEKCSGEYHIYCLDPPLKQVPDGDWFCDNCKPKSDTTSVADTNDGLDEMVAALPESFVSRFGEIVWAQGGTGYGWWPGCIYDPRLTIGGARQQAKKALGKKHLVFFFECDEAPFAVLEDRKIYGWVEGMAEDFHLGMSRGTKSRYAQFRRALQVALIEEGKPVDQRLDWNHPDRDPSSPLRSPIFGKTRERESRSSNGESKRSRSTKKKISFQETGSANASSNGSVASDTAPAAKPRSNSMYCKLFRRGEKDDLVGFITLNSRSLSFAEARKIIRSDFAEEIDSNWDWRFLVTGLGPVSLKQESMLGPMLPFLSETTDPKVDGSIGAPYHLILTDAPRIA